MRSRRNNPGVGATTPEIESASECSQEKKPFQHQVILSLLIEGIPFTKKELAIEYGIWAASARISELRRLGWSIDSLHEHPLYNGGAPTSFAIYVLNSEMEKMFL